MKKLLLLAMMCVLGLFSVGAQETITIGENTAIAHQFPIHTWWQYSYSQQIYTKSEINHDAADILKIAFYTDGTNYDRTIKIYMQNVTKSSFSSNEDWIDVSETDIVFEGNITTSSEIEITLDKPFAYTGGNLLLCIHDITNVDSGSSTKFEAYTDNANRTICMFDDKNSSQPGTENAMGFSEQHCLSTKTVLQITFDGGGETPTPEPETLAAPVVTATASNDSTIVLTWEAVENATGYNIYESDELIGVTTNLFSEIRGFEPNTTYCFNVTAVNEELESEPSEEACATTLEGETPEEQTPMVEIIVTEVTTRSVNVTFTPAEECASYYILLDTEASMEQWATAFGVPLEQLIEMWSIERTGASTNLWDELIPNTEYTIFVLSKDAAGEVIQLDKQNVTTEVLGGEGVSVIDLEVEVTSNTSVYVVATPNEETAVYHYIIADKAYIESIGIDSTLQLIHNDPYDLYDVDRWEWIDLTENTDYYAIAQGKNTKGEWGEITIVEFVTTVGETPNDPVNPSSSLIFFYEGNEITNTVNDIYLERDINEAFEIQFDLVVGNSTA
ncbi:MAG: fibronectin type III domain-containing protein, partial [Bacteroidales bacterium]|nr:fibronectin type III domain-containing protein [Bacteroidales bacterium]